MALDTDLGALDELAESLGILRNGSFNSSWFENPLGRQGSSDTTAIPGLTTALYDDRQREALITFADEALGAPNRTIDDDGAVWLPLVSADHLTVFAVVAEREGRPLEIGIGAEYRSVNDSVELAVTAHVRAFRVDRQGHKLPDGEAAWLLLGRPGGSIDLEVELTNLTAATPGEFHLGGASLGGSIPTWSGGDLSVDVSLIGLQLPGSSVPTDHHLDLEGSLDDVAGELLSFLSGLIKAQADGLNPADPVTGAFANLASLVGLRSSPGISDLPLAELPDRGLDALVSWIEDILTDNASRDAWLAHLADLLGGTADPAADAVAFASGPFSARVGLRTSTGSNGSPVITPWVEIRAEAAAGADVRLAADVMTIDTTTGTVRAFPAIDAAAVFGDRADNGSSLLDGEFDLGSLETGLRVLEGRPAFSLLLFDVATPSGREYDVLDLSTPEAIRDAAENVVGGELSTILDGFGAAGATVKKVLGLDAPVGTTGTDAVGLLTDPVGEVRGYWQRLTSDSAALSSVIVSVIELVLSGTVTVTGDGSDGNPWSVPIGSGLAGGGGSTVLEIRHLGSIIVADLVAAHRLDVLDDLRSELSCRVGLARIDTAAPSLDLVVGLTASLALSRGDGDPIALDLAPASVELDGLRVDVSWAAGTGLTLAVDAPGLAVDLRPLGGDRYGIPLPRRGDDGSLVWAPDWADIEDIIVSLLGRIEDPTVTALLDLVGWTTDGDAYLPLVRLIEDPAGAIRRWLADLVLDCGNVVSAMSPVTALLSGLRIDEPYGHGSDRRPFRAPIAGLAGAPGPSVWTEPPCPLPPGRSGTLGVIDPDTATGADLAAALELAAVELADIDELLFGRRSLADGLEQLTDRLAGTDGVVGRPVSLPAGVTGHDAVGFGYRRLVALGATDRLAPLLLGSTPGNRLYLGIEPVWAVPAPAADATDVEATSHTAWTTALDWSTADALTDGASLAPADSGPWSARMPSVAEARAQRPDRTPIDEQVARIRALLAGRTQPVTVIAFGQIGAAALTASVNSPLIERVITVASPWSPVAADAFTQGLSGDAVRFLNRLRTPGETVSEYLTAFESTPAMVFGQLLDRIVSGPARTPLDQDVVDLTDASTATVRPGLTVDAVFGRLEREDVRRGLAALVADAVNDRVEQLTGDLDELFADPGAAGDESPESDRMDRLHAGFDLPAFDLDVGGIALGLGVRFDALTFDRDPADDALRVEEHSTMVVDIRLGVVDGWLVGGPGRDDATGNDIEVRWLEARVEIPTGGGAATTRLILHEAHCFDVNRERWEIDAEHLVPEGNATTSLPEAHLILDAVVSALRNAVIPAEIVADPSGSGEVGEVGAPVHNAVVELLERLGVTVDGHYDPGGFERFLFDARNGISRLLSDPAEGARLIRQLSNLGPTEARVGGTGSELIWSTTVDEFVASTAADLADRSVAVTLTRQPSGLIPVTVTFGLGGAGYSASASLGSIDPAAGGLRLVAEAASGSATRVAVDWSGAGSPAPRRIELLPSADPARTVEQLVDLAAAIVPATLVRIGLEHLRSMMAADAADALDAVLDSMALLNTDVTAAAAAVGAEFESGRSRTPIRVPTGLFSDPVAWLKHGTQPWRSDPAAQALALLDAVGPLVGVSAPSGATPGQERAWPITDQVTLRYRLDQRRLHLAVAADVDHRLDSRSVATSVAGGVVITASPPSPGSAAGPSVSVAPSVVSTFTVDGTGLRLSVEPDLVLQVVRQPPANPITIHPLSGDVGSVVASSAAMVLPLVLNALIDRRTDAADSPVQRVARLVHGLGAAMDLIETDGAGADRFTEPLLVAFADDPVAALLGHGTAIGQVVVNELVDALGGAGSLVSRNGDRLVIGTGTAGHGHLGLRIDDTGADPAVVIDAAVTIDDVGTFGLAALRLDVNGLQATVTYAGRFDIGSGVVIRPTVAVSAGVSRVGFDRSLLAGVAIDDAGVRTVGLRWNLNGTPPELTGTAPPTEDPDPLLNLSLVALSLATSIAIDLASPLIGDEATPALRGVLLTTDSTPASIEADPQFFVDLFDVDALTRRLFRLLANLGDLGLSVDIGQNPAISIGYFADTNGGFNEYGLTLSLPPGQRFDLSSGDPTISLEVDDGWILADGPAGLTLVGLRQSTADPADFSFGPRIIARGLGLRVARTGGRLLDLGPIGIDSIALHLYGESSPGGPGVGARLQLDGLAITPTGGGDNAVASGITDEAAAAGGPNARPALSPTLAVQRRPGPGEDVSVTVRAGEPPGPWWLVVQRELGPLYLERFGFDATEVDGNVVGLSLLFDGRVSLFGLQAQVDQLGIHWAGGSITDGDNWWVDIQGFAVSADLSGVMIAGGLLKTEVDGNTGYLGMLTGRFGVYGLSLFGGYTQLGDTPSFFIFGAVNGPIGGPPAFFLTGIGGGLGINRGLRVPDDIGTMGDYPFIQALDTGSQSDLPVLDQIRRLDQYFPVEVGNIWFAAGISFTSFSLVDGIAVVSVSFGSGLDINLMGLARMALPRPEAALVSIELGLLARFSTEEGLFLIQAQLTDNSWLLYPEVRLTGGFAFATWWKGRNAGQFVLTLGGYHPSFSRPGYPEVPRLGLVWSISDEIVVKGGSYFALTSEALMAGLDVEVSADFGFAWAKITFGAHGIVYFDPFWFEVMAYAAISAGIKIKTFLGTIRISISLGASIKVEGPKVSGVATIEVGPAEFDVPFGQRQKDRRPAITWSEFVEKYLEEAADSVARAISGIVGQGALPGATGGRADAPSPDGSEALPYQVFAEFELMVVTTIPFDDLIVGGRLINTVVRHGDINSGPAASLALSPMQASLTAAKMRMELRQKVAEPDTYARRRGKLGALSNGLNGVPTADLETRASAGYGLDGFPLGVWGPHNDPDADVKPLPSPDVVFAGNRVKLVATASLEQPGPVLDYRSVEHGRRPLPLSAAGAGRGVMLALAQGFSDVAVADADQALATAQHVLFDRTLGADASNGAGGRSRLGRAGYRGSRTAPPLFGTLAEGLDTTNPAGVDSEVIEPVSAAPRRRPRDPMLVGHLGLGSGRTPPAPATSVSDKSIKRRPAPSIDSVKGRLADTMAIDLRRSGLAPKVKGPTAVAQARVPHTTGGGLWAETDRHRLEEMADALTGAGAVDRDADPESERDGAADGAMILADGEVVVMSLPDVGIDVDKDRRPVLAVDGAARVVTVAADGSVLVDQWTGSRLAGDDAKVAIPVGAARIAVVAGAPVGRSGRTVGEGWHDGGRLLWIGNGFALGQGCTVRFDRQNTTRPVGWYGSRSLNREAGVVTTRLRVAPRSLAVVLTDDGPGPDLDLEEFRLSSVAIELRGLRRRSGGGRGAGPEPAVLVQSGRDSVVIVEVEPDGDSASPRIRSDVGLRRVVGVIGSHLGPDELAEAIAVKGLAACVGDLTIRSTTAASASNALRWIRSEEGVGQ